MSDQSAEPAAVIAQALEAIAKRDTQRLDDLLHRNFEATPASPFFSGRQSRYRGRDGLASWLEDVDNQWRKFRLEATDLRVRGNRIYVALIATATPRRAEASITRPIHVVCEVRKGLIHSIRSFDGDPVAALAAFRR